MEKFTFKPVAIGIFLALAGLLLGELHGLSFGAKEEAIKAGFKATAEANAGALGSDEAVAKAADKAWGYLKRAHAHYMGLGALAVSLCLLVGLSPSPGLHKTAVSSAVGFGALVYPLFWTLASFKTAGVGSHAAKEALEPVALAGAGIGFLGLLGVIAVAVVWALRKEEV
ncbi:MAG: hypothetical protein ACNS63_06895 [Candidatus Nitrospinota bacterium M3_3B_026]